jgi:hypothetical protein
VISQYQALNNAALEAVRQEKPLSATWRAALLLKVVLGAESNATHARQSLEDLDSEGHAGADAALELLDQLVRQTESRNADAST